MKRVKFLDARVEIINANKKKQLWTSLRTSGSVFLTLKIS